MRRAGAMWLAACLAGCAGHNPGGRASPAVVAATGWTEDWEYAGHAGKLIRTPSYRLFTTATDGELVGQMPEFLEAAMERYTTAFGPLPRPVLRLDTFLMGDREQWKSLTRQVMGNEAATYLRIERGGFASGGRALLWSIGRRDTLAIAAHEGWHQYTQRAFRQELPAWLEEGVAVYMEGFVPDPVDPARPIFLGWANIERFEQLKRASERGELIPLARLLTATPQDLIASSTEGTLNYYAQLWSLVMFLREGDDGRHAGELIHAIADAANGHLQGMAGTEDRPVPDSRRVFEAYFGDDVAATDERLREFIQDIVTHGRPELIAQGLSPVLKP